MRLSAALLLVPCSLFAATPETRTVDVVDHYHGTRVADPYRWLEALESTEVREWAAAQTRVARHAVDDPALREWLSRRVAVHATAFANLAAAAPPSPAQDAVRIESTADGLRRHVVAVEGSGRRRVLADPEASTPDASVAGISVSPDGRHVAVASSVGGSEWVDLRIVRVRDGAVLADALNGLWLDPVWTRDGRGFFYVWLGRPDAGDDRTFRGSALRYHVLGTATEADRELMRARDDADFLLAPTLSSDGRALVVTEGTGAHTEGLDWLHARLFVLDLVDPETPEIGNTPVPLTEGHAAGYRLVGTGVDGRLHVLTDDGAPRRRVVVIDPAKPARAHWQDLIPQQADVLHRIHSQGDRYVAHYLRDAQALLRVHGRNGELQNTLALPPYAAVMDLSAGATDEELLVWHDSYLRPPTRLAVDLRSGATRQDDASAWDLVGGDYTVTRVRYPARDGTEVPMTLVHRTGVVLDGSNPVLMYGYGASHDPTLPAFDPGLLAWLEMGGVYAEPNIRGGGEFGRDWWEAALLERKQVTFDDFIDAAEYLVRERWTDPQRLGIVGASFGGLLVTAVMAERPDLFGAVIAMVPAADLLRQHIGRHRRQIGWAGDPAQFPFVLRHSPVHRLRSGRCYPPTLITTAMNDERVPAWAAFKFAATAQAAQSCDNPILLRVEDLGGHAGATEATAGELQLDFMTFAAQALGASPPLGD